MHSRRTAGYGTWTSPITADWVASHVVRLGSLAWDGDELYWCESRPSEEGKTALVKWSVSQSPSDVIRSPYSVRSRVHEYGGGAFWLGHGAIYFSNDVDRRLYRCVRGSAPQALRPVEQSHHGLTGTYPPLLHDFIDGCSQGVSR